VSDVSIASTAEESPESIERQPRGGERVPLVERPAWRVGIGIAIPAVVIGVFVVATWSVERFREFVGVLATYVPVSLYAAVVALLVIVAAQRLLHSNVRTRTRALSPYLRLVASPLALCGAVLAYLVPIVDKWENGRGGYSAIAGVIPWSDADGYFGGAQRLLFDGYLDDWSSRRPLNAAFLADRLAVTNLDLRLALVIQAILLGVACYIAARAVAQDLGPIAGLALFAGIYSFASFGVETTLSESLSVTLGAFAFAVLWNSVRVRSVLLSGAGLLLLALALTVRPGTVLLVLALALFFALYLRGRKRINIRVLVLGIGAIVAASGLNVFTAVILDGTPSNLNGSFYPTLYGLAKGNQVWTQVYSDYPELEQMSEPRAHRFIRAKAIDEIRAHPVTFIRGLARSTGDYLQETRDKIWGPVDRAPVRAMLHGAAAVGAILALGLRWRTSRWQVLIDLALFGGVVLAVPVLFGLWVPERGIEEWLPLGFVAFGYLGFVVCGTERGGSPLWKFAVVSYAGIVVSLGLTTIRDIGPRVYAATVPFFALAFASTVAVFARSIAGAHAAAPSRARQASTRSWSPIVLAGSIIVITVLATPVAMGTVSQPEVQPRTCPDGRRAVAFSGGVAVRLVGNDPRAEGELDELDLAQFSPYALEVATLLQGVQPPVTILQASRLGKAPNILLTVVEGFVEAPGRSVLYLCGQRRFDPVSNLPVFFGTPLES
jgi:hypothetical protein